MEGVTQENGKGASNSTHNVVQLGKSQADNGIEPTALLYDLRLMHRECLAALEDLGKLFSQMLVISGQRQDGHDELYHKLWTAVEEEIIGGHHNNQLLGRGQFSTSCRELRLHDSYRVVMSVGYVIMIMVKAMPQKGPQFQALVSKSVGAMECLMGDLALVRLAVIGKPCMPTNPQETVNGVCNHIWQILLSDLIPFWKDCGEHMRLFGEALLRVCMGDASDGETDSPTKVLQGAHSGNAEAETKQDQGEGIKAAVGGALGSNHSPYQRRPDLMQHHTRVLPLVPIPKCLIPTTLHAQAKEAQIKTYSQRFLLVKLPILSPLWTPYLM
mmetsp:Transcript_31144/g.79423  ORF Transcript_31144/g.79423 Transcript_31144/m.79423 type:complete len:328 (+) Transcript_31144:247-1230(+)